MQQAKQNSPAGRLYLCPSGLSQAPGTIAHVLPAANIELMRRLRYYVVENVRSARRFLRAACGRELDIDALQFAELSEHTRPDEVQAMLQPLLDGNDMGVLSEAGCPAVADPGALLVRAAHGAGIEVVPLVGPSSIILALMASGFNGQSFTFVGYLPVDAAQRASRLRQMQQLALQHGQTQIFIETPYRNNRLVAELARTLAPALSLCVASDLTGPRQSIVTLPARQWAQRKYDYDKVPTIFLIHPTEG